MLPGRLMAADLAAVAPRDADDDADRAADRAGAVGVEQQAAAIGESVARATAADVDVTGRFPSETFEALRAAGLLGALVPVELGGLGAGIATVARTVTALGRYCSSSAMVYAMHQIQVACLVRHGDTPALQDLLREVAAEQLLFASATTEKGIGGDVRSSSCCVRSEGQRFTLEKDAPVISYGRHADAVLATARRHPDSPLNDQVLVVCRPPGLVLDQTSSWSAMGMRGTCSDGFRLRAEGDRAMVLPHAYGEISSRTMLPVSHTVWSAVWLGIATAAVDRARQFVRGQARSSPGVLPPTATRLAELVAVHQQLIDTAEGAARRYEAVADDPDVLDSLGFAIAMNAVKVNASTLVVDVVHRALQVCGILGYREDTPFSMGRLLRDAHGGAVMVANDRINANNAQLLLAHKGT